MLAKRARRHDERATICPANLSVDRMLQHRGHSL
jgi:hypothetical protein